MIGSKERRNGGGGERKGERKKRKMVVRGIELSLGICKAALILIDYLVNTYSYFQS